MSTKVEAREIPLNPVQEVIDSFKNIKSLNPRRKLITGIVYFTFFTFGASYSIWSSVWPDLEIVLNLNQNNLKYGLTVRYILYAIGALASGFLFQLVNRTMMLMSALIGMAITVSITPWFPGIYGFLILQSLVGLCAGVIDTACNVWTLG